MKLFLAYIRLVRPFNLVIIVFTLYMVRFSFASPPFFMFLDRPLQVSATIYALFSLAFMCMAAGGYIINDYYDIEIDRINRPDRVIIGNIISTRSALTIYWILSIVGILIGFQVCYMEGVPLLGALFLFYLIGLWFYSYKLKSAFLLGNLLIALFIGLVPLGGACIELFATVHSSERYIADIWIVEKDNAWLFVSGVSLFAFLFTIFREIVKDAEDVEGDASAGCRTVPIVIGIRKTKWASIFLVVVLNILLGYVQYKVRHLGIYPFIYVVYFLVFMEVPFLILLYKISKASSKKSFHSISSWLKILMITCIFYVFASIFESYFITMMYNAIAK